jgi:hypothetical protein
MSHLCCLGRTPHPWEIVSIRLLDLEDLLTSNTVPDVLAAAQDPINNVVETVGKLSLAASKIPYYKFNNMWSRQMQNVVRSQTENALHESSTHDSIGGGSAVLGLARRPRVRGW